MDGRRTLICTESLYLKDDHLGFDPDEPLPAETYHMGDTDLNGKVTSADALLTLKHVVKMQILSGNAFELGDMDSDRNVTSADALEILKVVVKLRPDVTVHL